MKRLSGSLVCLAAWAGCGGDPVDVQGMYSVGVTNRDNGCEFQNWTDGGMTSGVTVAITQDGATATAEVQGFAGGVLDVALGQSTFSGDVEGNYLDMSIQGTRSNTSGNCTFTYDAQLTANLIGDALMGSIVYTPAHNGHSDCAMVECTSTQEFSGSRPPH